MTLRDATPADRDAVYAWNCAPDVRAVSKNPMPVSTADHARWFEQRLIDATSSMWIVEHDGVGVGVVRLDRRGRSASISIALDARARGRGIGRAAIARVCEAWAGPIFADIAAANAASRACFESCNFVPLCERDGIVTYRWRP